MKRCPIIFAAFVVLSFTGGFFTAAGQPSNAVASPPMYVPDYSHANFPLPDGMIAWDASQKTVVATNGQDFARFDFSFTNVSPGSIAILSGRGSCSCTTVQLPETPWLIPAGGTGVIGATINLAGKFGTVAKYAFISTDKGTKSLMLFATIQPPPPPGTMTEEERARGVMAAKLDRQAVFKGDCATCHARNVEGKFGQQLFTQVCAVCHEASPRSTMVPDLHNLKDPTSGEFWRTWITSGKAGTLMPAFATSQCGPLTDMQIASLAAYLNAAIPPQAPASAAR